METKFVLNPEQRGAFECIGVLPLPGYFSRRTVAAMADAIWSDLGQRFGIDRARRESWTLERPAQFQALIRTGVFDALGAGLGAIADVFLGAGCWTAPKHFSQPLVMFPTGSWSVPNTMWHLDVPPTDCLTQIPAIRIFTILEPVHLRGGDDRTRRFMVDGGHARGFDVRVQEMTGEPGDVFVMHPATFHTIARNALDSPRTMLVQALTRRRARTDTKHTP